MMMAAVPVAILKVKVLLFDNLFMVVQALILMNRRLFLFSTACNSCNFESTRTLRRLDSNASPSRLVEGIGVDSATPPSRLGEVSESTRGSAGVEPGKYRSRVGEITHPTVRISLSKTPTLAFQNHAV